MKHGNMFKDKSLIELVPQFPETLSVREKETGKVQKATIHEGALYFLHEKKRFSDTGRVITERKKSIVSPFRLNKYFEKA